MLQIGQRELLILEFEETVAQNYAEKEARVLLALYFTDERLAEGNTRKAYQRHHGEDIAPEALLENLAFLERLRTIRRGGDGEWELLETVTFRRDG